MSWMVIKFIALLFGLGLIWLSGYYLGWRRGRSWVDRQVTQMFKPKPDLVTTIRDRDKLPKVGMPR